MHYCPGCTHGVVHKILSEVIEEMDIQEKTIGIAPVGCAVLAYNYIDIDWQEAAHGRAPALATGAVRVNPDKFVFTYQGDGDLAAIGTAETIHACNRGENIVIIFVNNGIYGMTGGQMAPTTLTRHAHLNISVRKGNRDYGVTFENYRIDCQFTGTYFVTRQSVHTHKHVRKAKKAIKTAFMNTRLKKGLSFVEIVSNCNSGWKMNPNDSNTWMEEHMFPYFPLGDIKVKGELKQKL